jgi:hypothetical protein
MKAIITIDRVEKDKVFIIDRDGPMSVTNDAEAVVAWVNAWCPERRIIYRDTMGQWDELLHSNGRFDGFAPYHP